MIAGYILIDVDSALSPLSLKLLFAALVAMVCVHFRPSVSTHFSAVHSVVIVCAR